ncbi:glutamate synthase-related protein [Streptomyces sp. NPDC051896]|uniref:glutamate synthase-related protein n=1 Tax=Streptomyces sp. NPDC051896 TaxID=3155416 RepID=UPI003440641E
MCHTNTCPVGLATQDPRRASASNVHETSARVHRSSPPRRKIIASPAACEPADVPAHAAPACRPGHCPVPRGGEGVSSWPEPRPRH